MTLLRRPWDWKIAAVLGEEAEKEDAAFATAERLRRTSLLETVEVLGRTAKGKAATTRRYTFHPDTAQFVRERFGDNEPLGQAAHRRLGDLLEAEARISPFIEVDLEAGHHLFQAGEYDRANELLGSASQWLQQHGRVREGLQVLEPFLDEQVRKAMPSQFVGQLLGTVGVAHHRLGEVEKAIRYYERALVIDREIGDRQGEGIALGNLGVIYRDLDEVKKAIGYYEQQLGIVREIGDRQGEGNALGNLGNAYILLGEAQKAIGYQEQQLVIVRDIGDRQGEGRALGNLGSVYSLLGEMAKAIGYYEQRLVIAHETEDRRGEGSALGNLGVAYASLGEAEKATALLEQALQIGRAIKDPQIIRNATTALTRLRGGP